METIQIIDCVDFTLHITTAFGEMVPMVPVSRTLKEELKAAWAKSHSDKAMLLPENAVNEVIYS